jgi:hypothetical protein
MLRHPWLFDAVTGWRQFAVVEVLRTEWSSPRCREEQIVRLGVFPTGTMSFEQFTKIRADRKHPKAAARFRSGELAFRKRLGRFHRVAEQINALPAKSENLAVPHPGQNGELANNFAWLLWIWREGDTQSCPAKNMPLNEGKKKGTRIRTGVVEVTMPLTMGAAMGFLTSEPMPDYDRIGIRQVRTAITVRSLRRKQGTAPSTAAA